MICICCKTATLLLVLLVLLPMPAAYATGNLFIKFDAKKQKSSTEDRLKTLITSKEWRRFDSNHRLHYHHYGFSALKTGDLEVVRIQPFLTLNYADSTEGGNQAVPLMNADHILTYRHKSGEWHGIRSHASKYLHRLHKRSIDGQEDFHSVPHQRRSSRFSRTPAELMNNFVRVNNDLNKQGKIDSFTESDARRTFVFDDSFEDAPIRAAYHFPLTSHGPMTAHRHLFVDAETGKVLHAVHPMRHATTAPAYVFPAGYNGTDSDIRLVNLTDITPADQRQSSGIRGQYHRTANTCPFYLCDPTGETTKNYTTCRPQDVICFQSNTLESIVNPQFASKFAGSGLVPTQVNFTFTAHAKLIDATLDWESMGFSNFTVYLRYTGLPAIGGRIVQDSDLSFKSSWLNSTIGSGASYFDDSSPTDAQSEAQIYYSGQQWFKFIKQRFTNQFCTLTSQSAASCSQLQSSVLNQTEMNGTLLMVTNLQAAFPDPEKIVQKINEGYGRSVDDPVTVDFSNQLQSFDDAFFYTADGSDYAVTTATGTTGGTDKSKSNCEENSECLFALGSPGQSMIGFGQGMANDWSMEYCIAAHELMHSVTNRLIPWLADFGRSDSFGSYADPGMLSEGWSDYWAAVHCGRFDFSQAWIKAVQRSVDNQNRSCNDQVPGRTSLRGQIHSDSQIFSGALWELRELIGRNITVSTQSALAAQAVQIEFDEMVLAAEAMATATETAANQLQRILTLLETAGSAQLQIFTADARRIFNERELNCKRRIFDFAWQGTDKAREEEDEVILDMMYIPGTEQSPISDFVPAPLQLRIQPEFTALLNRRVALKWQQVADDRVLFPQSTYGYALQPLLYAVSWGCPARFEFNNSSVRPVNSCTNETLTTVGRSKTVLASPISYYRAVNGYISINVDESVRGVAAAEEDETALYVIIMNPNPVPITLKSVKSLYEQDPVPMIVTSSVIMIVLMAAMSGLSRTNYGQSNRRR